MKEIKYRCIGCKESRAYSGKSIEIAERHSDIRERLAVQCTRCRTNNYLWGKDKENVIG